MVEVEGSLEVFLFQVRVQICFLNLGLFITHHPNSQGNLGGSLLAESAPYLPHDQSDCTSRQ